MKLSSCFGGIVIAVCVCGLMIGTGCRPKPPKTAEGAGAESVGTGAAPLTPRPSEDGERVDVKFANVQFAYNSFQVTDSEVAKIKEVGEYLKKTSDVRLVCEGNCDERGTAEYNVSLGENRALAVRAFLIGLGVESSGIQTKSFGKDRPLDPGHDEAAWSKNRRVECVVYKK